MNETERGLLVLEVAVKVWYFLCPPQKPQKPQSARGLNPQFTYCEAENIWQSGPEGAG